MVTKSNPMWLLVYCDPETTYRQAKLMVMIKLKKGETAFASFDFFDPIYQRNGQ